MNFPTPKKLGNPLPGNKLKTSARAHFQPHWASTRFLVFLSIFLCEIGKNHVPFGSYHGFIGKVLVFCGNFVLALLLELLCS